MAKSSQLNQSINQISGLPINTVLRLVIVFVVKYQMRESLDMRFHMFIVDPHLSRIGWMEHVTSTPC